MTTRDQEGFTLIELLVVILIIAILAAIAIPVFLNQRKRGWEAQHRSALKNAALAIETYAVDNSGSYAGLDEYTSTNAAHVTALQALGFQMPDFYLTAAVPFRIEASSEAYCISARHALLGTDSTWRTSTYESQHGEPRHVPDSCPEL